jgi:hypothetical protein
MSVRISGMGWVTPLGADLDTVWQRIANGDVAEAKPISNPETGRVHHCMQAPPKLVEHLGRNPRLRRSSAISYFAVAAALRALDHAGIEIGAKLAERTAVIFAVSDGGVIYTRKFYDQIVKQGANAASPLLFPETVYNAPASHLAAQLGIDGASYTLVGDASVGLSAIQFGEQLLALGEADVCVVVACEELDWILCEAYHDWRFARTPLAEGAAAVVLSHTGRISVTTAGGVPFARQRDASGAMNAVLERLAKRGPLDFMVSCNNGSFVDRAVDGAVAKWFPGVTVTASQPKLAWGEMLAAGGLANVIYAALRLEKSGGQRALVPVLGFNHQADAAVVEALDYMK